MVNKIKIYKNFKILRKHQNAMILIGNFDGLHLGHQRLFKEAKKYKKKYNSKIGVV
ncbi:riboflavin biosynthesis protein RibF, partial [Candidatus Pelagibacter sp.]|nr:riboflavin biosynthesis protein RibF [Candidatus Pelagibacter sp.]